MAINRPTSKTIISTTGWGWPITDEVNRLTDFVAPIYAAASLVANISIPSSGETALQLASQQNQGFTFAATGWTIVKSGMYRVGGNVLFSGTGGTGSYWGVNIKVGSSVVQSCIGPAQSWVNFPVSYTGRITAGQVLSFTANTDQSGAKTDNRNSIWVERIGD